MYTQCSDDYLLERLKVDDEAAFEVLYDRYWSKQYAATYTVLRNREACCDIVQDVFVQLWQKRHKLQIQSLPAYLHSVTRYQVFRAVKAGQGRTVFLEQLPDGMELHATVEESIHYHDLTKVLERSLVQLPEKCREIFRLKRHENLTTQEIATQLNISPKTVENQLTKALKHLRVSLQEFFSLLVLWLVHS